MGHVERDQGDTSDGKTTVSWSVEFAAMAPSICSGFIARRDNQRLRELPRIGDRKPGQHWLYDLVMDASDAKLGWFPAHRSCRLQNLFRQRVRQLPYVDSDRQSWLSAVCRREFDAEHLLFCINSDQ